jgi:signal transduction histidine kinase
MELFPALELRNIPIYNLITLLMINFIALTLVLTVFNHNKFRDIKSKIFLFMSIFMLLWVDFAYLARIYGLHAEYSVFFLKIAWMATPPLFYFTYLASMHIAKNGIYNKYINYFFLFVTIFLSLITISTSTILTGIKFTNNTLDISYGYFFFPFLILIFLMMIFTLAPLMREKLNDKAKFFMLGVVIFYLFNSIFNISLPVFFGVTHLYYFGDYSTIFLLGFTTFAILKHKLFDVKIVTTEILTAFLWFVLLIRMLFTQGRVERMVDFIILTVMVIFGILLVRSVIKEVQQREKLEELTQKLKEIDKQKDEFVSMAAHELRTPMTAIKGYLSMVMEGDTGDIPEKARGFLADANSINERLIRLVNNMLNVNRMEEGRIVYQLEDESLARITQTVFHQFIPEAERKGLKFVLKIPNHIKDTVNVDIDKVDEVIGNFISNAVKYTEEGTIEVAMSQPDINTVKLEVKDTGPGISKEEQQKLFRKFYRVESNVGKTTGTGLGLYISKMLIEKFGGKIGVESDTGKGCNFWFELPVVPPAKTN